MSTLPDQVDVLIIGAGQAGLALAQRLRETSVSFILTEHHARVGDSWRRRFDSLALFTPRRYSALPGLSLEGDPDAFPNKDEIADYLERYSQHFGLPVRTGVGIIQLHQVPDGFTAILTDDTRIHARAVVLATGAFQDPVVPAIAKHFSDHVAQFTAASYRSPDQLAPGPVLVVGDGATGRQIAAELAGLHQVTLATGRPRRVYPDRIFGKSVFWWMDHLGILRAGPSSFIGKRMKQADAFPGKHLELSVLQKMGIRIAGKVTTATGTHVTCVGGQSIKIENVIWAIGYRDRTDWVAIPEAKNAAGAFIEVAGVSPVPGLYFIGRSWQTSRGSALLLGVGDDARIIADHLCSYCLIRN
ncbi:MAG: NAD(P)/FAD-dependent oxidoreductase [Pseudomonadota bacterium]